MEKIYSVIKNLIKRYWFFLVLALIIFFLIILVFTAKKSPLRPKPALPEWQGISPGKTKKADLMEKLGEPLRISEEDERKIIEYPSDYKFYPHQIYTDQDEIILIKEMITNEQNLNLKSYTEKYGEPDLVMYENNLGNAYAFNIFLDEGLGIAAHLKGGNILEIWYFKPVTKEEFERTIGKDLFPNPIARF